MIDTSLTIHTRLVCHRALQDEMEVHVHRRHQWNEIGMEDRAVMVGTAMECLTKAELLDLFINSDSLEHAVAATGFLMKESRDSGDLQEAMRACAFEVMERHVMEAYEHIQFDLLNDGMNENGMHAYTNRDTGELEWRRYA